MKATVVVFPGINADAEMVATLRRVSGNAPAVLRHTERELPAGTDLVAIPGGFAYGDYLRAGAIARVAPIIAAIRAHADAGGYVLGVCNGFQILTEVGLLPGALTRNVSMRFLCGDAHVKVDAEGPFTPTHGAVLRLPLAHGEGRYQASEKVLERLEGEGHVAFRYCDRDGHVAASSNPNGSIGNIAGIYGGPRKNVLGLMPHPERMSDALLGGTDGLVPFEAVMRAIAA